MSREGDKSLRLAERTFRDSDQKRFAAISGDHNPIHIDALQARRTQAGAPVVHGIHLLLWALDSLAAAQPHLPSLRSIRAQFNKFVYVDERVDVAMTRRGSSSARLNISVDNVARSKAVIEFGDAAPDCPDWPACSLELVPFSWVPLNLQFEEMLGRSGCLSLQMNLEDASALFPDAMRWLGARRIAALVASSRLVGMICPGLHSIYSELMVHVCAESSTQDCLAFRTTETDQRFRSVEQEIVGSGLSGVVRSFARMPPVQQATMESLVGLIAPTEFAGSVVLIVGGSRGLGELTAKLIATGGGRVLLTWQSGKDDAEKVAQEIRSAGGRCETLEYDVGKPADEQLASLAEAPTHAYYYATPTIYRPRSEIFVAERLREFLAVYVDGFWKLSQALRARRPNLSIFYPSSIYVTERPPEMTEYTMAKAAGEVLCSGVNGSMAPTHVTVSRLPRLPTDQTATITAAEMAHPVEIMLPIIREVQSWPR